VPDRLELDRVRGFVFDVDGTLVHRGPDGRGRPQPIAQGLREDGLPIGDDEVLTPLQSAITYVRRRYPSRPAMLFASAAATELIAEAQIPIAHGEEAELVLVAHVDEIDFASLERAARAVKRGAPLLTGSYVPGYAGANGMIFSRGAMVTAAIAKVTGARPRVVGKPSRAAVAEVAAHFGMPTSELAVIGDDLTMDIALGRMGGSRTVLVRSGISGQIVLDAVPEHRRPDAAIDGVADLLELL
jgi:NagD protein